MISFYRWGNGGLATKTCPKLHSLVTGSTPPRAWEPREGPVVRVPAGHAAAPFSKPPGSWLPSAVWCIPRASFPRSWSRSFVVWNRISRNLCSPSLPNPLPRGGKNDPDLRLPLCLVPLEKCLWAAPGPGDWLVRLSSICFHSGFARCNRTP